MTQRKNHGRPSLRKADDQARLKRGESDRLAFAFWDAIRSRYSVEAREVGDRIIEAGDVGLIELLAAEAAEDAELAAQVDTVLEERHQDGKPGFKTVASLQSVRARVRSNMRVLKLALSPQTDASKLPFVLPQGMTDEEHEEALRGRADDEIIN